MKEFRLNDLKTVDDVREWFRHLLCEERLNFHPEDSFSDYINAETYRETYTIDEIITREKLRDQSISICRRANIDICDVCLEVWNKVYSEQHNN